MDTPRSPDQESAHQDLGKPLIELRERTLIVAALLDQIEDWASSLPSSATPEKLHALIIAAREHAGQAFEAAHELASRFA